ncbi:MAG: hypothetical protein ACRDWE_13150, partial [Acidimicrobiales bacterium]
MLALHAAWDVVDTGALVLWAEDGERLPEAPRRPGRATADKGRVTAHPFAAETGSLFDAMESCGAALLADVLHEARSTSVAVVLPCRTGLPDASSSYVRLDAEPPGDVGERRAAVVAGGKRSLRPFTVPALCWSPGPALDVLLALSSGEVTSRRVAPSVTALARLGELALEVVAGGRVLPTLAVDGAGRPHARWEPLQVGLDTERLVLLARSLPPATACLRGAPAPSTIVSHAFAAFVDAACRVNLHAARDRPPRRGEKALGAWVDALGSPDGAVRGVRGVAGLSREIEQWRSSLVAPGGSWRLCFRLQEPTGGADGAGPWRVALLLQAADDPSLLVAADEVWRSGESLRRAARTVDSPQEVLLAELGRAVHAFRDLVPVLSQPTPTHV